LAIGSSTGGPKALGELVGHLPKSFEVPILIVQHMPPVFTKLLAERLGSKTELTVLEAEGGELVKQGSIYVAPGGAHLEVRRRGEEVRTQLTEDAPVHSCRPSVDVLFRSVARTYGGACLAVVLTGMGRDGLRGCEELSELGAQIVVQDEQSSVVWGMPGIVAEAGLADAQVAIEQMGFELKRRVSAPRTSATCKRQ